MTTRKLILTDTYVKVNNNPYFFVQITLGAAKICVSDTLPTEEDAYIMLTKGDVLTSSLVDGTLWAQMLYFQNDGVVLSVTE